jgi:nicotinamide-nucleotide amidase
MMQTDVCVAISGIAGPDGGSAEKPVGTMWICVGNNDIQSSFLLKAGKDRIKNIETATIYALFNLRKFILDNY